MSRKNAAVRRRPVESAFQVRQAGYGVLPTMEAVKTVQHRLLAAGRHSEDRSAAGMSCSDRSARLAACRSRAVEHAVHIDQPAFGHRPVRSLLKAVQCR